MGTQSDRSPICAPVQSRRTSRMIRPTLLSGEPVHRTSGSLKGLVDVRIDHGGLQALVAQQQLDRADVGALRQKVSGEGKS